MKLSLSHIRHTLIATATCTVTITIVWWGLWTIAAAQYRHVIDNWIEEGRSQGYEIIYGQSELFGFPRHVVLRYTNVHWRNTDNILFQADDIDIAATPWRWHVFDAKFKNHVQIAAPISDTPQALFFGGDHGRAHIELDAQGYWQFSKVELSNAHFGQAPNYVATADKLEASAERPLRIPTDHTQTGLTLTASADNVQLPETIATPFGTHMNKLDVDMRVMGMVPDFRKKESVDAWNKESGVVEFENLHMDWGPLNLLAKGTMGFDDDLQPEGAFIGTLTDHMSVLKALMENGYIAKNQETMMSSALSLFAKPTKFNAKAGAGIELPIAVQLGGLFLGPVRIFAFPPIEWPEAAPQSAPAKPQ